MYNAVVGRRADHVGARLAEARRRLGAAVHHFHGRGHRAERDPARPAVVQPGDRQAGLVGVAHVHHVLILRPAVAAAGAAAPPADDRQVVRQRVVRRTLAAHLRSGVAVVARRRRQPHGLPHRRLHLGLTDDAHGRGLVHQRLGAVPPAQAAAAIDLPHPLVEHPRIPQRADGGERLPVDLQRPHQVLVAPVGGHPHAEGEALAARIEVGRLPAVLRSRREVIGRAGRHVRLLLVVAVEIAEPERVAAVRVGVPALVHRLHRLPAPVQGLRVRRRAAQPAAGREQPAQQRRRPPGSNPHACPSPTNRSALNIPENGAIVKLCIVRDLHCL